ncbi:UBAP1-MVB12-associated (UMA)-domain containing protein 1 [Chanos chanos]|uniref:UBAP1-MVB12-associated (UMA)-domain containing protein 1 n=1 Tax=Chanos chanos TaxID=29144 RepID=A0A6J2WLV7_CHACN|nr:UBAP1-MVB12-associated (UMA)-domain containing protein 1 [Chanos chanos]
MFNFLGLRKDSSKKSQSEKEADGFVIIGETAEERKHKVNSASTVQPATNVIVQPAKSSSARQSLAVEAAQSAPVTPAAMPPPGAPSADVSLALPELLGDVPFTLAPHILAMQAGLPFIPDLVLPRDINDNLANFRYDFTLENSVLSNS